MVRNSLDPDPEQDPDWDFWLDPDPDSMNMDPKHWVYNYKYIVAYQTLLGLCYSAANILEDG